MSENDSIQYSLGYQDGFLDAKKQFERPQDKWVLCSECLPDRNGWCITTCEDICGYGVHTVFYDAKEKKWDRGGVIAWQPLPEPYKKGGAE